MNHLLVYAFRWLRDSIVKIIGAVLRRTSPDKVQPTQQPSIRFLGLWDTVAAYGLPIYEMTRAVDLYFWPMSMEDRYLNRLVDRACRPLPAALVFRLSESQNIKRTDQERISQVWFAGMHANVGGGYPDDSMAHVPLDWIASEAERLGLKFKPTTHEELHMGGDPTGRLYNSRRGLAGYYRYGPRRLDLLNNDKKFTNVVVNIPTIHESVFQRILIGVGAPHSGVGAYTPVVLPETYAVVRYDGTIEYGPSNALQTCQHDQSCARRQERAWDRVWWRRVIYFLTPRQFGGRMCGASFSEIEADALQGLHGQR